MKVTDAAIYPKFAYYVEHNLPDVVAVPSIVSVSAMAKIGQLNTQGGVRYLIHYLIEY